MKNPPTNPEAPPKQAFWDAAGYEDTRSVAQKNPDSGNPYIAILALDGDEMGKWMSGENARPFLENLAGKAPEYFKGLDVSTDLKRALSPAYHLQFSEALSNVSLYIADQVVSAFGGQLIYAGGDDVLAMLPAMNAIHCAQALRFCFRGQELPEKMRNRIELQSHGNGFVSAGQKYPLMVPGLEADVSCGIAVGHYNHPLQALVREAQKAEKRAKDVYGRSAFALSLMKRSGEIIHWGAKWDWAAIDLYDCFSDWSHQEVLSGRFPYALAELLKPYQLNAKQPPPAGFKDVVWAEFLHVLDRQSQGKLKEKDVPLAKTYLEQCVNQNKWQDFSNLFLAETFINRQRGEN
jgi:CRISPR/Cas system-associated protein Cas10 (large subunit of type III CRISPR-Cas system)